MFGRARSRPPGEFCPFRDSGIARAELTEAIIKADASAAEATLQKYKGLDVNTKMRRMHMGFPLCEAVFRSSSNANMRFRGRWKKSVEVVRVMLKHTKADVD